MPRTIVFEDFPKFKPNLTPREIFQLGAFGGTYWRPIKSKFFKNTLKNKHHGYASLNGIPESKLSSEDYDTGINKYKVKVGTSLEDWESKGWIKNSAPYGWVQWYTEFYEGKRTSDDERQIKRWEGVAGEKGRFRKWLVTQILQKKGKWDDHRISPKIRQTLLHWGYELTASDFEKEVGQR